MKVLPKLNMNKHPEEATNGSLIDAVNMMVSKDNFMLQTEPTPTINKITDKLKKLITTDNYNIFHIIPCNRELIIFVNEGEDTKASLYRYNETEDNIKFCTKIEWHGGYITGTFTYNNNDLIIAFSEYFDGNVEDYDKYYPLCSINLGTFYNINEQDLNQLNNTNLHPICPVVKIPTIKHLFVEGNAYKGWYYVFIRYKISNNTYTQWFNTNHAIFVHDTNYEIVFNYYSGIRWSFADVGADVINIIKNFISDNSDIADKTFQCIINNISDYNKDYDYYQLGFINVIKSSTKAFITNDIHKSVNTFTFAKNSVKTYSASELIKSYNNYYNAKTITNVFNRLYIANYAEQQINAPLHNVVKNIKVDISFEETDYEFIYNDDEHGVPIHKKYDCGIQQEQPYNFFIHFVDKYGNSTNGINLKYFTVNYKGEQQINDIGNYIIFSPQLKDIDKHIIAKFKLSSLPYEYIGYFVSFEKLQKRVKYYGVLKETLAGKNSLGDNNYLYNFYSHELNFADNIDFDFGLIKTFIGNVSSSIIQKERIGNVQKKTINSTRSITFNNEHNIQDGSLTNIIRDKQLFVADSNNNILQATNINLTLTINNSDENGSITGGKGYAIAELIKSGGKYYNNSIKELIPCSDINYDVKQETIVNTNNSFQTTMSAFIYADNAFYNAGLCAFQEMGKIDKLANPLDSFMFTFQTDLPWTSLQYNNKPNIIFFPVDGVNTSDPNKKSFIQGCIVEAKNTIDLYQQINTKYYDNYPKSLDWLNPSILIKNVFSKTIRRSNIYQDESHTNAWRQFEQEQYKNINENKGDIIKLISIGYYFIAHTEHSMFLFNSTDTLQSEEGKIQLANADIWDINYKEVLTSTLGYAGIQKEWFGIVGSFGYIFYDNDAHRLYQYDNQQIKYIDQDIINFISNTNPYDVKFVEDKKNNRILIKFTGNIVKDVVLSYNYVTNTFVSRHDYKYINGYNTKENLYLIDKDMKTIKNFDKHKGGKSTVDVIINTNYETMKYIDNINYKLRKIHKIYNVYEYSPVEGFNTYYAGDKLRIYSDICDTGILDVSNANPTQTINKVGDYTKPYWHLGNWHFNALRDKMSEYINNQISNSVASRVYGNYFIVHFEFNTTASTHIEDNSSVITELDSSVEIESVDGKLLNATIQ